MAEWPPIDVTALPDPSGTDPLGSYPLIDPIIPTELIQASSPTLSPENRVAEYIDSRTETIRALLNSIVSNLNAIQEHFLDRDGDLHVRTDELTAAKGSITLSDVPNDADSITLDDGLGNAETFEFDSNSSVTGSNILVTIGASATATASNLVNAINNAATTVQITASKGPLGEVRLVHDVPGSLGNVAITGTDTAGVQTLTGMSGGLNDETVADPSYMRGHFDMGGFKIISLADAVNANDLITIDQYNAVLFDGQDDVEQVLDTLIVKRDGTVQMGADLNCDSNRVVNLGLAIADTNLERKTTFDTFDTTFTSSYINLIGTNAMTGDLDMQASPTDPRYKVTNLGNPTDGGDAVTLAYLETQLALIGGNYVPVGALQAFAGLPAEISGPFLLCDGREVSRTLYQNLFLVIGTLYGVPTNVNVFKLPDLRGRAILPMDNMSSETGPADVVTNVVADQLSGKLGTETHALTIGELPSHAHTYDDIYSVSGSGGAEVGASDEASDNTSSDESRTTGSAGSSVAHPNMQPSMSLRWYIRY